MSGNVRSDIRAFEELETLVHHLGDELAAFRRRALSAEAQLRDAAPGGGGSGVKGGPLTERLAELEAENASLRDRVTHAEQRVKQMLERLRFLRQQMQAQSGATARSA